MVIIEVLEVIGVITQFLGILFMLGTLIYSLIRARFNHSGDFLNENSSFRAINLNQPWIPKGDRREAFVRGITNLGHDFELFSDGKLTDAQWDDNLSILKEEYICSEEFILWWKRQGRISFSYGWRSFIDKLIEDQGS